MNVTEAAEIADEQLRWWDRNRVGTNEAWFALTGEPAYAVTPAELRGYMIRWLLSREREAA